MNANEPAFPIVYDDGSNHPGLTKREYFAALAMQGLISETISCAAQKNVPRKYALGLLSSAAVDAADALIAELEKAKP